MVSVRPFCRGWLQRRQSAWVLVVSGFGLLGACGAEPHRTVETPENNLLQGGKDDQTLHPELLGDPHLDELQRECGLETGMAGFAQILQIVLDINDAWQRGVRYEQQLQANDELCDGDRACETCWDAVADYVYNTLHGDQA